MLRRCSTRQTTLGKVSWEVTRPEEHLRTQDLAEAKSREKTGSALQQLGLDLTDRYLMFSVPTKPKGSASLWDVRI